METGAGGGMFYYLSTRPKPVMQFRERRRLGLGLRFITYLEERKPDGRTDGHRQMKTHAVRAAGACRARPATESRYISPLYSF